MEEHLDDDYTQDWGQPWFKEGGYIMMLNLSLLRLLVDTSTDFKN